MTTGTAPAPPATRPLVALVGPPNAGKSTLFNRLTGLRQKIANYPGVTVEKKLGVVELEGGPIDLVDLPGVNGFSARTLDERLTRDVLEGRVDGMRQPDALILIVDSTRLEPQLMLVEPVMEIGVPTLLVLNMSDELAARGGSVDAAALGDQLGVEVVPANARSGEGVDRILDFLEHARRRGPLPERPCPAISNVTKGTPLPVIDAFAERRRHIREVGRAARFEPPEPSRVTQRLDSIFLHRVFGPLIFLGVVLLVFQAMFTWATPFMDGVEGGIAASGEWIATTLPDGWFRSLLIDGVWAGVGSVVVFLPQILILFFFLGILEDSGYMARAAVIADRMMHRVGLQGRSFLPLLSAYACAVPAILASRTVEDERDRLATMFVAPFMTCSARLPVYALLIAAFIPDEPLLGPFMSYRSATLLGLYAMGLAAAVVTAFILKRTLLRGEPSDFLMELPPYRVPTPASIGMRLWDRTKIFMKRAGKIILTVTVVLWGLAQFPGGPNDPPPLDESVLGRMGQVIEPTIAPLGFDWQIGIGLISSLAAREVIVGTLGTIYGIEEADEGSMELQDRLQSALDLGSAIGLLIFFVFALQCLSTVAVMRRETAGWKWPALQFGYMLGLAWAGAWVANVLI